MHNRYSDFEELRPTGEASHIPDAMLSEGCDGEPRRQRVATSTGGYPDEPTDAGGECQSCGASIPADQTKCRFCLTNHLDRTADDQSSPDSEQTLLDVVHLLVEASTFYTAVAKGSAAATFLVKSDAEPAVDDCQLIYDLDEAPAPQLADECPSLPSAIRVTSESGAQLLAAVRERTTWTETTASSRDSQHATFLYDETGSGIHDETRLAALLDDADADVWLVPGIALQHSVEKTTTEYPRRERRTRESLECRDCDRYTEHRFRESEAVPDDAWAGQPIWECPNCGMPRYGPDPEAGQ